MSPEHAKEPDAEETYAYYPGCSLHGTAREFDDSVHEVARILNVRLIELPDWNCCGASSAHMTDHRLAVDLAARNLRIAERIGKDLLVPCAACFHRLKAADKALRAEAEREGRRSAPGTAIRHLSEWVQKTESLRKIRDALKQPLNGLRLVPYYGCLITRPPAVTDSRDHEDPKSMDLLIRVLGGEVRRWSYKTECCGGSLALGRSDITTVLVSRIVRAAFQAGAQGIVTMCPMCQANLESNQMDLRKQEASHPILPIFFATELIALCVSGTRTAHRWKAHLIDPAGALGSVGL